MVLPCRSGSPKSTSIFSYHSEVNTMKACVSTRICKPNYWTQLVDATEHLLTRQMDPDFMIWCQQSLRKMIILDVRILTAFFFLPDPTMDTLLCALVLRTIIFFVCTIVCFFLFVAIMTRYPELKTDFLRRFSYADFLTQRQHIYFHVVLIGFCTDKPQNFFSIRWCEYCCTTPSCCRSTVWSAFG